MRNKRLLVRLTEEQFKKLKIELVLRNLTVQAWLEGEVEKLISEKR